MMGWFIIGVALGALSMRKFRRYLSRKELSRAYDRGYEFGRRHNIDPVRIQFESECG